MEVLGSNKNTWTRCVVNAVWLNQLIKRPRRPNSPHGLTNNLYGRRFTRLPQDPQYAMQPLFCHFFGDLVDNRPPMVILFFQQQFVLNGGKRGL